MTERLDEQRMLLINELNPRFKNTLAAVQSLAMQTLRNTEARSDGFYPRRRLPLRTRYRASRRRFRGPPADEVPLTGQFQVSVAGPSLRTTKCHIQETFNPASLTLSVCNLPP